MTLNINLGLVAQTDITISTAGLDSVIYIADTNQIAAGSFNSNAVYFISPGETSGVFDSSSPVSSVSLGQNRYIFYSPELQKVLVANQNFSSISLISKDTGGKFSSSSSKSEFNGFNSPSAITYSAALNQIIVANAGTNTIVLVSLNPSTGVFDSGSTKTSFSVGSNPLDVSYAPALDAIVVANNGGGSITILTRPNNTIPFSSTNVTTKTIAISGSDPRAVSYYSDIDKIIVSCGSSNKIALISRNASTSIFDNSSTVNQIALVSASDTAVTWAVYNSDVQKIFAFGLRLFIISLNPGTGVFDSGSAIVSATYNARPTRGFYQTSLDRVLMIFSGTTTLSVQPYLYQSSSFISATLQTIPTTTATWQTVSSTIYYDTSDSTIAVTKNYSYEDFSLFIGGIATIGLINFSRTNDTTSTLNENLKLLNTAHITGLYSLSIGANKKLILGTLGTYSDSITMPSTGTLVLTANTTIGSSFILNNGTTVNASGGSWTLTLPYANPGLVAGSGVTIVAPQPTLTFTGLPSGVEARITQGSYTIASATNITSGVYAYSYSYVANELIEYNFNLPGYVQIRKNLILPSTNQTIALSFDPDPSYI